MDPALESRIQKLLLNNEPPLGDIVADLDKFTKVERDALASIRDQIAKLDHELATLQLERERLEDYLRPFNTILSPARRLPFDILALIFWHCLPDNAPPSMIFSEAPLLFTHVCRMWKEIALSSPRLWTSAYIRWTSTQGKDGDSSDQSLTRTEATNAMMQQCDLLEAWLDRSGPCLPLYLDVEYEYIGNDNFIPQDCTITRRTISILASRLPRWAVVRMRIPFEIYEEFDRLLKPYGSPLMLQALDIRLFDYGQGRASRNQQGIESGRLLVEAPRLRRLSTHWAVWDTLTLSLSSHLTYLDCFFYPFDHQAALELLSRLPLLIECRLTLSSNWDAVEPNMATFLPNLKSLKIIDNGIILCHIKIAFYDCLSMPNLESLSDKRLFSAHPPSMDEIAVTGHPLFFAIHKNKLNLKSLAFAHYGVQGSAIEQVFKNLPSLTRLQLGAVDFYGVPGAYIQHPVNHYEYFDLCALIIDVDDHDRYSQNSRITATSRALPLLPNLTQFVGRGIQHISDDTLSQFILSRLDPVANAKRGIATLKLVEVEFARFMEQDIGPVIMQRAKDVGIEDFQLRLEYLPIPEGTVRCVSPFD